jgi:PhnB protein
MTTPIEPNHNIQLIPDGYHTVTPWIIVKGASKLIDFLKEAFDGQEMGRVLNEDGKTIGHAEVRIGDSVVMLFDARENWSETPCFLRLYVHDSDRVYEQALKAGAVSVTEMRTHMFGDRVGRVRDPFGNIWWIQTHREDVDANELERRMKEWSSSGQSVYADAMRYTQETLNQEMSSRAKNSKED